MPRTNSLVVVTGLCRVVAVVFFYLFVCVIGVLAQSVPLPERLAESSQAITNLAQLSKLLDATPRVIAGVRLDVLICSASRAEIGVVAVKDKTGSGILELGSRGKPFVAGDLVRIESPRCFLRQREMGVEITRVPDIFNDGMHALQRVAAEIHLTAGLHPFQLDYFNYFAAYGLALSCRLPDGSVQSASHFLVRPGGSGVSESNLVAGAEATCYEDGWMYVPDFALLEPVKTVPTTSLNPDLGLKNEQFGIRFKGFFSAPMDGNYTFNLESDDGSLLFLDAPELPLTTIGHETVPQPVVSSLHAPMTDSESSSWMSVEGRAVFVSKTGKGLQFELRSQPDSIWVRVSDGGSLDPSRLLNSRVRITGVGRAVTTPNGDRVLGELMVATADNLKILEDSKLTIASPVSPPALVAIGQIQSLSKEEAARHLPVRIRGVVTGLSPPQYYFMSVQDETRGVFVQLSASILATAAVGQLCEVNGYTDTGDFAPIIVARDVDVLGTAQMPSPKRPTWKELINGSMDVQWVELQGLVTAVQSNSLSLLLPEGELHIEAQNCPESQLRAVEKSVIRIRGVLFAVWNTNRTVQVGRLLMRNVLINVDIPAPRDPFDEALKSWSELYQFDSRATPFQRVKVRGTVIFGDARGIFIVDKGRGIRVSPFEPTNVRFGEVVEVVGYPDIGGSVPLLREAIIRKTGEKADPQARIFDGSESVPENLDSTLVRISATLMGIHSEPASRVLEMNAGGHLFLARLPDTRESVSLRIGSRLALTGVYVGKAIIWSEGIKSGGFELLLSSPAQITVLSQPSWWTPQRLLITVGLLLAILALAAVWISQLHRLVDRRTRQLQQETREREVAERERALETERSRIARDLHDDLGSSLTEISVLASKGQRLGTLDELVVLFRAITAKARGLVTALDVIVWAVDPKDNSLESVADYLGDFAGEYLSHSGIACRFDIPVALPPIVLEGRLRHGLLLAVKETLNNVERHAQATEVEFRMAIVEDQLEIVISDNGKGFDTRTKHRGNGLKNLPLRLSKLGGRYTVESSLGNGTVVTIGLRISPPPETAAADEPT